MTSSGPPKLQTERLQLEPVHAGNLSILWGLMREPHLRDYQDIPRLPLDRFADRLRRRSANFARGASGRFEWVIFFEATPVGWISIRFPERTKDTGELGYSILLQWRRRGIASEAIVAVTTAAFVHAVVDRVEAYCLPENIGSKAALRKAGLIERKVVKHGAVVRGKPVDVVHFDITAKQWPFHQPTRTTIQEQCGRSDNLRGL